jgi:hypothetical protein
MTNQTAPSSPESDDWSFLDKSRCQRLERSWAGTFRNHLLEQLPTAALSELFPDQGGRPRKDYQLVLGVLVLQQLHDLTDAETVEAISFNLSWHYALRIAPYSNPYLCERTLRNYRRVVIEHQLEQRLFRQLTDQLVRVFKIDSMRQRIDSTAVCSAMRQLNRLGIIVETVSKFVRELGRCYPQLCEQIDSETIRLYVKRTGAGCFGLTKPSEAKTRLPEAAKTLGQLVLQFAATEAAQLHSYLLLKQVFDEQCAWEGAEGEPTIRIKTPDEIPCDSIHSPADPDSSYNKHRGHGYSVQIMETYAEDDDAAGFCEDAPAIPDLILHVAVGKLTEHDSTALEPAIADVRERGLCPTQVLGDSHYGSQEQVEQMHTQGIQVISPAMPPKGYKQGQITLEQFELDASGAIIACPQGHPPDVSSVSDTKIEVRFDLSTCKDCPLHEQCPGYQRSQSGQRWRYTPQRVATRARRLADKQPQFKERYRWRAGIEGTMSRLKYQMGLSQLRVRGMSAVRYTVFLRALGLNIQRVSA